MSEFPNYRDFKGKGTKVEYPHNSRAEETKMWKDTRQIPREAIIQSMGFWWITLPDDKHPEAFLLPNDNQVPPRYVHRSKCITIESVWKILAETNRWYRERGGRPKVTDYMPELKEKKPKGLTKRK